MFDSRAFIINELVHSPHEASNLGIFLQATRLKRKYWWQNMKMMAIIGVVVAVILLIIIISATSG